MAAWYDTAFSILIVVAFFVFIYAKITKKSFKEIFNEVKNLFKGSE